MSEPLLVVENMSVKYGPVQALFGVNVTVEKGSVVAMLGANGAGKSTFARAVSGLVPMSGGTMHFDGQNITKSQPHQIRLAGLTHVPEGRGIFPGLSVFDNLKMAVRGLDKAKRDEAIEQAIAMFPVLGNRRTQRAGSMSGGEQQMLALARALAVTPKMIIADEMSLGLAPMVVDAVFERLNYARSIGVTIIIIEQFVHRALQLADQCVIMRRGEVSWAGAASDAEQAVLDSYLGESASV
ncbi:MAG: ABC transporter ATP-binding protein [Acidimicrobiia bacterium]